MAEKIWAQGISLTSISLFFFCTMPLSCPKKGLAKGRVCGQKNRWSEKELTKERVCGQENGLAKEMVDKKRIGGQRNGGQKKELVEMELVDMLQQQRLQR